MTSQANVPAGPLSNTSRATRAPGSSMFLTSASTGKFAFSLGRYSRVAGSMTRMVFLPFSLTRL